MSDAKAGGPDYLDSAQFKGYGLLDIKVVPCTEDFKSETMGKESVYTMCTYPRGSSLIISNITFTTLPDREGGNIDLINIRNLLDGLSLETSIIEDLPAQDMKKELQKFSQHNEHFDRDCCVVVIMTHGTEGHIYGTDGEAVPLATVFSMFDNDSCPSLSGKPKVFIIQACQGDKTGGNRHQAVEYSDSKEWEPETASDTPVPPVWKTDMFIAYPSPWGYQSVRTEDGSPFLGAITKVFSEHAKDTNLLDMMTMVNKEVSDSSKGLVQPEVHSTLRKQLYFFPGEAGQTDSLPWKILRNMMARKRTMLLMMLIVFLPICLRIYSTFATDHDVLPSIPVAQLTIHSYVVGTEGRVIQEAGGVELIFPKGCVSEERVISVEVDVIPVNDLINRKFMAMSAVLTVKQSRNTPFLQPVTVTLPVIFSFKH